MRDTWPLVQHINHLTHLDACIKWQINLDDPNYNLLTEPILLRCGHVYHKLCLQLHEHKCLHCFEYIKYEIRKNVKSIIERITTKDNILTDDDDLGEEIISEENDEPEKDEPEKLPKQRLFDVQAECQFKEALKTFLQG